ncbi:hypothetical protein, partial [Vibrio cholerae]|uniref:hypothetical protein n=1 Tax=Vibrio cholerae TaxID=666 RepID=UPI001C3D4CB8
SAGLKLNRATARNIENKKAKINPLSLRRCEPLSREEGASSLVLIMVSTLFLFSLNINQLDYD